MGVSKTAVVLRLPPLHRGLHTRLWLLSSMEQAAALPPGVSPAALRMGLDPGRGAGLCGARVAQAQSKGSPRPKELLF